MRWPRFASHLKRCELEAQMIQFAPLTSLVHVLRVGNVGIDVTAVEIIEDVGVVGAVWVKLFLSLALFETSCVLGRHVDEWGI